MADFRSGARYKLNRKASRIVEITAVVSWTTVSSETKKVIAHTLFSMSPRQASRYGKATAPKLLRNGIYEIERPDKETFRVKLYREKPGEGGKRFLWMRRVVKP